VSHSPAGRGVALVTTALCIVATAGCGLFGGGTTRSEQAFCSTYATEKSQFLQKYSDLSQPIPTTGPDGGLSTALSDIVQGVQSLGDATVILTKLDKVAPSPIEPDMDAVLASWKQEQDTLGDEAGHAFDPAGALGDVFKGIFQSIESEGSWERVNAYIAAHCGTGS
jgi:hypothetical protein